MREYFILNGVDSRDFGVYISGQGTFSAPEKAYTFYSIPGRNGALLGNEHRLENIEVTYEAFIYTDFDNQIAAFRSFLLSLDGYQRLTDSYHPDEYRMAVYKGPFDPVVERTNDAGKFNITFSCKPQRFLMSGETWYKWAGSNTYLDGETITSDNNIDPTYMEASYSTQIPATAPSKAKPHIISPATKLRIRKGSTTLYTLTKGADEVAVSYNLISGTGSATLLNQSNLVLWETVTSHHFRCQVTGVSALKFCSHYPVFNNSVSNQNGCWLSGSYIHVYDVDNATISGDFQVFLQNLVFTYEPTSPRSVTITPYTPSFSAPFTIDTYYQYNGEWYKSGESPGIEFSLSMRYFSYSIESTMVNPTIFKSQPIIRVFGTGSLTVNDITVTISSSTSYVDIDCEMMDCYEGSTNRNNDVAFSTYDFPVLLPGDNPVTIVSGVTEIDIQPRWWRV